MQTIVTTGGSTLFTICVQSEAATCPRIAETHHIINGDPGLRPVTPNHRGLGMGPVRYGSAAAIS